MDMSEGLSVYQKRLLTCAAIVRNGTAPFDMRTWQGDCGTTHCAVGDYCQAGVSDMKLVWAEKEGCFFPELPTGEIGYEAACRHFGVHWREADKLFCHYSYKEFSSRSEVADRIERFALHEHADAVKVGH